MRLLAPALVLLTLAGPVQAMEWRLGLSYVSGVDDVADLYEDNLRLAGRDVDVDLKFPLGVAASFVYDWTAQWRTDVGIGPVFAIGGDVKHIEVPLTATMGYNFSPYSRFSPYVRGGLAHHFASGDQYSSSSPGLLFAVGVDFTHFALELATDRSEVEFDRLACDDASTSPGTACRLTATELNTYDVLLSFYWRFRLNR